MFCYPFYIIHETPLSIIHCFFFFSFLDHRDISLRKQSSFRRKLPQSMTVCHWGGSENHIPATLMNSLSSPS